MTVPVHDTSCGPNRRRLARRLGARVIAVVALALSAERAPAQPAADDRPRFDGRIALPQNTAFDVIQDHQAFLWVGTNDGLARYDGHSFAAFRHRPGDAGSLSHNTVRRVQEDRAGRLWVRTEAGLDRYDRLDNRFHHYPVQAQQLFEDAHGLIVASHDALHHYDATVDRFTAQLAFPLAAESRSPSADDPVWGLRRSRNGSTWLTTANGHLFGVTPSGAVRHLRLPWREAIIIHEDPDGRLWIGHDRGLAVVDPEGLAIVPHHPFDRVGGSVFAFGQGRGDEVWFGGATLYRSDARGTRVTAIEVGDDPLATPIRTILVDREGLIWLATPRGLRFHNPYAKRWLHAGTAPAGWAAPAGTTVMAVTPGTGGQLWVGSLDGGVEQVTAAGAPSTHVQPPFRSTGACPDQVWALMTDSRDRVWAGSAHGLCVVEANRARQVRLTPASAEDPVVFALRQDHTGGIWVGTTGGLFRLDPVTLAVRHLDPIKGGNVEGLLVAADGAVWAGTSRSDMYRIDPGSLDVVHYPPSASLEFRGSEGFWTIAEVGDGRFWLGSDRGLFLFDPAARSIAAIDDRYGVPVAPIYAILTGERGGLWLSTRNGLLRHDNPLRAGSEIARTRRYTTDDGLPFDEFNRRAAASGPDGWLTFGGMGGIVSFHPAGFRDNPHPPPVHVVDVERTRIDGPPEPARPAGNVVTMAVGDAGLVLHLSAPTFASAHREQLLYRMDGVDADWIPASSDRRARYPALAPGRHTFRMRAANADGVWNLEALPLTVVVPTPWWAAWWFRLSAGLLIAVSLVTGMRWILTRPLRRRVRALELEQRLRTERERISRDLHDNVGSQVATLLAAIELAGLRAGKGELGPLQGVLADLREDARRTIGQLRETVWSLRHDHISLRDLLGQVQDDLRNRQRALEAPQLKCAAHGDMSIELGSEQALHLFRITQEAITNAIRHARATVVDVEIVYGGDAGVRVTVRDDGVFQEPAAGHHGSGLASMRSRAGDIGARFSVDGTARGTTIEVVLPPAAMTVPGSGDCDRQGTR